jgi:class 3 adenylate cyclase/tetratricopeptide (TPR) repeat protein
MDFVAVPDQVIALLRQRGRLTYSTLKRQFQLDDAALEDVKNELIEGQHLAVDERGNVLVWTGAPGVTVSTDTASADIPTPAPLTYTPSYLAEKILTSRSALEGERKQVTVLFADLKGSMELLADRDPEEARQLLDPVLERMMAAVHRYEGTVNQVMGDGIMALFGAPVAHEDHAARACYTALAMQDAIRRYSTELRRRHGMEVQIRVGLNSGEVVVRTIGNDLHMDYSAIGQTTHLAARMEQLAMPGSIRLTAETLRLAEGLVQVTALGPVPVKGLGEPVEVFELVGASALRRRLQVAAAHGLTRFVGRQPELAALQQALERTDPGHGEVVALVGEAGVGKSRLVYEFVHTHHAHGWLVLEGAAVSYGKATPYLPVLDLLKRYTHVEDHDDTRTIRAKVTGQVLTLDETLHGAIPALLSLLDALPEDSPFLSLDPPQRRRQTLEALKRIFVRESQEQPLLLVCEDLHWIDTETQAWLDSLVESLPTARLLLLVNYRPEYQHGWGGKTYYTQLRLDPLLPASAEVFLQALVGHDPSLAPLTPLLIARTQGNPFFLEESVRTLVEAGSLVGDRGAYRLAQALPAIQVPATVQAVLAARIDRLAPEDKRCLQTAAVIGTEVPLSLLQAIAEAPAEALQRDLEHLQAAEFLYETRLFPEREYIFKHALTHEVAYGSLLQERRRLLHARIVEALEALAGEQRDEHVDRLAHHALRGEVWDKAVTYCRQAGTRAVARSANQEAVLCFEQALEALAHLPESRDTREQAIDLRLDLERVLSVLTEYSRLFDHMRAAEALAQSLNDQRRLGLICARLTHYFWVTGDHQQAVATGQRAHDIALASGDVGIQVQTNHRLGQVYYSLGAYGQARDLLLENVAMLQGDLCYAHFGASGLLSVGSRQFLVWSLAELGAFPEGRALAAEGLRLAEAVEHPFSLIVADLGVSALALRQGEAHTAIPVLERALSRCQTWQVPLFLPLAASLLGVAYALCGRLAESVPLWEQGVERAVSQGQRPPQAPWGVWLGEAQLLAGCLEEVQQLAQRALALSQAHQERGNLAYALRLLGESAARRDPPDVEPAVSHYRQALALAEALGMRPLQAHCHRGLGMLYATVGQQEQARAALSTAIEMYRAMAMTFWLPQAEALLAAR